MKKIIISFLMIFFVIMNLCFTDAKTVQKIKLNVNNQDLIVDLEENDSTKALISKLKDGSIKIEAKDYGSFEKVGKIGFTLPSNDKEITTQAGDLILFDGDQISLYYDTNMWSLTRLGKVENMSQEDLKTLLGTGSVTMTLSIIDEENSNTVSNTESLNIVTNTITENLENTVNITNEVTANVPSNSENNIQITVVKNNVDTTTSNIGLPNVGESISRIVLVGIIVLILVLFFKYNKNK